MKQILTAFERMIMFEGCHLLNDIVSEMTQ